MRYILWVDVLEGNYIPCSQSTHIELLQDIARGLITGSYIFDHVKNIKVWHRDADGTEVYEEVSDGSQTNI